MEEQSICLRAPLLAEADTEHGINTITKVSSVADADTVINTNNTNSSQTKGDQGEDVLLDELLTDDYCHVCEAVLLFESQRVSHYEGKRHAQKLRMYLQTKRAEKRSKDPTGLQRIMTTDKERFCQLCSMVFSSPVVARSHYEGKVHAKNLRRQGLYPSTLPPDLSPNGPQMTQSAPNPIPVTSNPKPSEEGHKVSQDPPASTDVDLSDPNKHCRLCAASFNNPQMALQHYNGRKHQRNHSRQQLLRDLGEEHVQANCFTCPICSVELNSVEMYQAHMQGNKHQIKEKKVVDLCKSQKKVYDSFRDELADYIQVQKARGLSPKTSMGLNEGGEQNRGEEEEEEEEEEEGGGHGPELNPAPPTAPPHPASLYPPAGWRPPYQAPPTFGFAGNAPAWVHALPPPPLPPPPLPPGPIPPRLPGRPPGRRRPRDSSSTSSYTSSSSSYTSSSDSDYRHRERKRRRKRSRRERGRRVRGEEDSDQEETRRKRRRREGGRGVRDDSEGRRGREEEEEEEGDRRRTRRKRESKSGRRGERRGGEEGEEEREGVVGGRAGRGEETEEKREDSEASRPKQRKEKRKTREKVDTRTEEEKLWDESILGL